MEEKRNLIVTCGISQIFRNKLILLNVISGNEEEITSKYQQFNNEIKDINPETPGPGSIHWMEEIMTALKVQWGEYLKDPKPDHIARYFGSEVSTLIAMLNSPGSEWDPACDRFVLLASDSTTGLFSAMTLKKILIDLFQVQGEVQVKVVNGLNERPSNPKTALNCLAENVNFHLLDSDKSIRWYNVLVATGGFRSVMPCMTIFSLLYGLRLVYLFESSQHLQLLHPRYRKTPGLKKIWDQAWKELQSSQQQDDEIPLYVITALKGRETHNPKNVF